MKVSDYIIDFIREQGVDHVFGYIGGAITHMVDSMYKTTTVKYIQVYHEQTAALAAEGYAKNSGKVGVAMATSGPGATNLMTGIADAYFDSIPTVFITGQVNTYEFKYDKPIRQQGFQETDIVSIVKSITKYATIVSDPEKIRYELEKAFYLAKEGRPGPVVIDIPMNIQRAEIDPEKLESFNPEKNPADTEEITEENFGEVVSLLKQSKRPIILAGGGIIRGAAEKELLRFAKDNHIPVVASLMGKGSFPEEDDLFVGVIGAYGNRCANITLANADLLFALGSRMDTRQIGTLLKSFLRGGKIIHVDLDKNEIEHHRLEGRIKIRSDVKTFLNKINSRGESKVAEEDWLSYTRVTKEKYSQAKEIEKNCTNKLPYEVMQIINKFSKEDQIYCVDVGQNQMFAFQTLQIRADQKFFTSGGLAPMGCAVPFAVGASFSDEKKKNIIAITGDGGLHISTQALMLISQYDLPIKVIVLNNYALGMITQFQDLYFDKKKVGTTKRGGYVVPNLKALAKAYSLPYYRIDKKNLATYEEIIKKPGPCFIEVVIRGMTQVYPKLEVNNPIEDISPKLSREELKESMIIDPISTEAAL